MTRDSYDLEAYFRDRAELEAEDEMLNLTGLAWRRFFEHLGWPCQDTPEDLSDWLLPANAFVVPNGFLGDPTLFCAPASVSIEDLATSANTAEGDVGGAVTLSALWRASGCAHVVALPSAPKLVHRPITAGVDWLEGVADDLDWRSEPRTPLGLLCSAERTFAEVHDDAARLERLEQRGFWLPLYFLSLSDDPVEALSWAEHRRSLDDAVELMADCEEGDYDTEVRRPGRRAPQFDKAAWMRANRPDLQAINATVQDIWHRAVQDVIAERVPQ